MAPLRRRLLRRRSPGAYRDWRRIVRLDSPGAWVRRVAINLAISAFRRRQAGWRARRWLASRSSSADGEVGDVPAVLLRQALQQLSYDHRFVLVLRSVLDLPIDETARLMGRTATSVTTLTRRAPASLRAILEDEDGLAKEVGHDR